MSKKLNISQLCVSSFVTTEKKAIKGGLEKTDPRVCEWSGKWTCGNVGDPC